MRYSLDLDKCFVFLVGSDSDRLKVSKGIILENCMIMSLESSQIFPRYRNF